MAIDYTHQFLAFQAVDFDILPEIEILLDGGTNYSDRSAKGFTAKNGDITIIAKGKGFTYDSKVPDDGKLKSLEIRDADGKAYSLKYLDGTFDFSDFLTDLGAAAGGAEWLSVNFLDGPSITPNANIIKGSSGADNLAGGDGSDLIKGGRGNDAIDGGTDFSIDIADYSEKRKPVVVDLNGTTGIGVLVGGVLEDTLDSIEGLKGGRKADQFSASGIGGVDFSGNGGADILIGGEEGDNLYGGKGNDTVTGGEGNDLFRFNTKLSAKKNVDTITDFNENGEPGDIFWLDWTFFRKLENTGGGINPDNFRLIDETATKKTFLVYDEDQGFVYYDSNAKKPGKMVLFAKVDPGTEFSANIAENFVVVDY